MKGLFSGDNFFTRLMNRVAVLFAANLLFVLCCLPVVTAGAGLAALYYTTLSALREKWDINPFTTFWEGLKENFRQATAVFFMLALFAAALSLEIFWCGQFESAVSLFRYGLYAVALAAAVLAVYLFPVMAAFRCSLPQLLRNSVCFAFRQPAAAAAIVFLHAAPMAWTFFTNAYLPLYAFLWCTVGFSGIAALCARMLLPLFRPYLPALEEEALPVARPSEKQILREMRKLGM